MSPRAGLVVVLLGAAATCLAGLLLDRHPLFWLALGPAALCAVLYLMQPQRHRPGGYQPTTCDIGPPPDAD